jgi:hypothetical protein
VGALACFGFDFSSFGFGGGVICNSVCGSGSTFFRPLLSPGRDPAVHRLASHRAWPLSARARSLSPVRWPDRSYRSNAPIARLQQRRESRAPARNRRPSALSRASAERLRFATFHSRCFLGFKSNQRHV